MNPIPIPDPNPDLRRVHATGLETMTSNRDRWRTTQCHETSTYGVLRNPEANHDKNHDKDRDKNQDGNPRCAHSYG